MKDHLVAPCAPIRRVSFALLILSANMLSACGRDADDPAAGGLTVGEAEALDRAADKLDARRPSPGQADAEALEADVRARLQEKLNGESAN